MEYRPRLRPDLESKLNPDGEEGSLFDPVLERRITLGAVGNAVARRLDGQRTFDEIAAELSQPRAAVEDSMRTLSHLNLVEGSGAAIVERVGRVRRGDVKLGRIMLDETRFACQGSGDCCQSYHFGPLTDSDVALLASLPIKEQFPHLGDGPYWYERDMPGGGKGRFLNSVGDSCEFLEDNCRCGLHAHFGFDKKPGLCRYYPFEQFATVEGVHMYDKGACSLYAITARSGEPLAEQLSWMEPTLPRPILQHPIVLLDAKLPVDFAYVHPLMLAAVEELQERRAPVPDTLRAVGRRLRALMDALRASPLGVDEPRATAASVVARPREPFYQPAEAEAVEVGAAVIARVAAALVRSVTQAIASAHLEAVDFYSARQSREIVEPLHVIEAVAMHVADSTCELPEYYRQIGAVSVEDPDIDEVLRLSLRQALYGYYAMIDDRPAPGLLRQLLVELVALFGARLHASREGRTAAVANDLNRGHMLANRCFIQAHNAAVFKEHEPLTWAALEALPALARWR